MENYYQIKNKIGKESAGNLEYKIDKFLKRCDRILEYQAEASDIPYKRMIY